MKTSRSIPVAAVIGTILSLAGSAGAEDRGHYAHHVADHIRHDFAHAVHGDYRYARPDYHHYEHERHHYYYTAAH